MTDRPQPKRRPSVGGVRIPSKAPPADAPPSEREFQLLLEIRDSLAEQIERSASRLDEHDQRLDEHEDRLLTVRKGQLDAEESLRAVAANTTEILKTVNDMRGTDIDHERRIATVEAIATASGQVAGQESGRKAGATSALQVSPIVAGVVYFLLEVVWPAIVAAWKASGK